MTVKRPAFRVVSLSLPVAIAALVAATPGGCGRVGLDPPDDLASTRAGTGGNPPGTGGARGMGGTPGTGGVIVAGTGGAGGSDSCTGLDAATCQMRHGCAYYPCSCRGGGVCMVPQPVPPSCECPINCSALDEVTCQARSSVCRTDYCSICGMRQFAGCAFNGDPPPLCQQPPCIALPCSTVTTADACEQRPDCHAVFTDDYELCDCVASPCNCILFASCAEGTKARCTPPAGICKRVAPYCGPGYALAYTDSCFEGCVLAKSCAD